MKGHRKEIHLAARLPGGSQADFDSFVHLARTAERGLFDFVLLDGVGQPDTFTVLSALAAVTDRLGLVGTVDTTVNEPFEVARQVATLDHLSDGRAGWHLGVDADRYPRAEEFLTVVRAFWDSWDPGAVRADAQSGVYADAERIRVVENRGKQFDVRGPATLPAGPQGHPILLQAGDSTDGREFGAAHADVMFTPHSDLDAGRRHYSDVKARAIANGRDPQQLMVFAVASFTLGTAEQVAAGIDLHVQSDACDGFILVPPLTPQGLDEFVDSVVPLLQQRGAFRTGYDGYTLREHLAL